MTIVGERQRNDALPLVVVLALFFACLSTGCTQRRADLAQLRTWMTGSFSSAAQHAADPENFFDIDLHMAPIWTQRSDGPWLYVEQAAADSADKPDRQRVYQLRARPDDKFDSVVYTLPGDPLRFVGAWQNPARLNEIAPRDLTLREGCTIILRRSQGRVFVGSTEGQSCESELRGASYETSEVFIEPDRLASWDRGFDANHEQVWGATAGGYVFVKTTVVR